MKLNFQYAHHSHEESETVAGASPSQALAAFDDFDWYGESVKANELKKCSPTLSLIAEPDKKLIWVSSYGDRNHVQFVSDCHFPGEVSAWFGLKKKMGIVNLHSSSFSIEQARTVLELFGAGKFEQLRGHYNAS